MKVNNTLIEVKPGKRFPLAWLKVALPTVEQAMFFAKAYKLTANDLAYLLMTLFKSNVVEALTAEGEHHSIELQDYLIELGYEYLIKEGSIVIDDAPPHGEILPELWKSFEVDIANSIQEVADKLKDVVSGMPGKEGNMLFKSMMVLNAKRPIIGDHKAYVHHAPKPDNLVILDVSGSMTERTIRTIVEDVVALSYEADAWLAIVSNTPTYWEPGAYSVEAVLDEAEYMGTHYETLAPLLDRNWGVVVTIADYDSSPEAAKAIANCLGNIDLVLDISLVKQPTYLSEVVGQLAAEVRPLLVAADNYCCM